MKRTTSRPWYVLCVTGLRNSMSGASSAVSATRSRASTARLNACMRRAYNRTRGHVASPCEDSLGLDGRGDRNGAVRLSQLAAADDGVAAMSRGLLLH